MWLRHLLAFVRLCSEQTNPFWCEIRESNSCSLLGKQVYYRYTNLANQMEPMGGFEPPTFALRKHCSTS
jgi:hypothetical protein